MARAFQRRPDRGVVRTTALFVDQAQCGTVVAPLVAVMRSTFLIWSFFFMRVHPLSNW
jgi:hypothetical protein